MCLQVSSRDTWGCVPAKDEAALPLDVLHQPAWGLPVALGHSSWVATGDAGVASAQESREPCECPSGQSRPIEPGQ